jgi:hypothetical protein
MTLHRYLLSPLRHFTADVTEVEEALTALPFPWTLWMSGIVTDNALLEVDTEDALGLGLAVAEALARVRSRAHAVGQALHPDYSVRMLLPVNRGTDVKKLAQGLADLFGGQVDITAMGAHHLDQLFLLSFGDATAVGLVVDLASKCNTTAAAFEPAKAFGLPA